MKILKLQMDDVVTSSITSEAKYCYIRKSGYEFAIIKMLNFNLLMVGILSYIWWLILMMLLIVFAAVLSLNEESTGIKGYWLLWILSSTFVLFVDFKFFIPTIRKKVVLKHGGLRASPFPSNKFKNIIYYSLLGKYYITCIY